MVVGSVSEEGASRLSNHSSDRRRYFRSLRCFVAALLPRGPNEPQPFASWHYCPFLRTKQPIDRFHFRSTSGINRYSLQQGHNNKPIATCIVSYGTTRYTPQAYLPRPARVARRSRIERRARGKRREARGGERVVKWRRGAKGW